MTAFFAFPFMYVLLAGKCKGGGRAAEQQEIIGMENGKEMGNEEETRQAIF
jgi:hypothetical protein